MVPGMKDSTQMEEGMDQGDGLLQDYKRVSRLIEWQTTKMIKKE